MINLRTVPVLSDVALLVPAAVLESDWDKDELPAVSSLLDAWGNKDVLHRTQGFTFF